MAIGLGVAAVLLVLVVVAVMAGVVGGGDDTVAAEPTSLGDGSAAPATPAEPTPAPSTAVASPSASSTDSSADPSADASGAPSAEATPGSGDLGQLRAECGDGVQEACTDLFLQAEPGSDDERTAIEGLAGAADGLDLSEDAQREALDLAWENAAASDRDTLCATYLVNADAVVDVLTSLVGDGFDDVVVLDFLDQQCA